jgi:hypothetical protein
MKIRIKGDSIRIRLTRSEVAHFGKEGYLEESTDFGTVAFVYALQRIAEGDALSAAFDHGKITMYVPDAIAHEWTTTDKVGFENNMDTGHDKHLFLLIEKDFKCIDAPANEDQSDNFEHPTMSCS